MGTLLLTLALLLPTDEPTAYQNPDLGLSLLVPAGWVVRDGDPEGQAQLVLGPPEGDAMLRFSVRVSPASASSDPRLLRDQLVNNLGGRSDLSDLDEVELTIAGRPAPGIGVTITVGDKVLRIEQHLLIENGQLYVLEARAPESDFRAQTQHFSVLREGFRFLALSDDQVADQRLAEIASRCGSEVGFANSWKEAAKRAAAIQMSIERIVGDVGLGPDEILDGYLAGKVELTHLRPALFPVEAVGDLPPERIRVIDGALVHFPVVVE